MQAQFTVRLRLLIDFAKPGASLFRQPVRQQQLGGLKPPGQGSLLSARRGPVVGDVARLGPLRLELGGDSLVEVSVAMYGQSGQHRFMEEVVHKIAALDNLRLLELFQGGGDFGERQLEQPP